MKCFCTLVLLMLNVWLAPHMLAQPQQLRFEHLGVEDGLMQGSVVNITQDRQGFLWIGTLGGLHRYDGHTFEAYTSTPFDTTSLADDFVQNVTEAENGDLWVATANAGLDRLDRATGRFTHYRHDPDDASSLSHDRTTHTLMDRRGDLWVATHDGLNRLRAGQDGRFTRYHHDPSNSASLSSVPVYRLSEDTEGHIWAGSANGISRIDPETDTVTRFLYDATRTPSTRGWNSPDNVFGGYNPPDEPGILWLSTGNGLVRFDSETGAHERFLIEPEQNGRHNPLNFIPKMVPDPLDPDVLWVSGRYTGLARFDRRTGRFTSYRNDPRDPHSLSANVVFSLFADRSGTLWVGYRNEGLSRFNPGAVHFAHLRHDPDDAQSLAPGIVWAIYEDRGGTLWVSSLGVTDTYLTQFDAVTGRVTRHRHDPNDKATLPPGMIQGIAEDAAGQFWVSTRGGLCRLDRATGRVTRYLHDASKLKGGRRNRVRRVLVGRSDGSVLWVGSDGGLDRFDTRTGRFTPILREDGVAVTFVGPLHEDAEGILWAGTREGLLRVDLSGGTRPRAMLVSAYDARDTTTISQGAIMGITERDREPGILWVSTAGGLNRFDTKTGTARHYFRTDEGLPDNVIYGALEDEAGTLWMGTNRGLSNFDPETETFRNYGLDDGLIALEFNGGSYARGAGGELYFGTGRGVTVFMPERLSTNTVPPQVALIGFKLFNKVVVPGPNAVLKEALSETDEIRLHHDQNHFDFDYVALHFANPAENRYVYRLEGFDSDWIDAGTDRTATYTNVPPGSYTFRVKAANSDGVWNEEGASVRVFIAGPWWHEKWAYLLYGLLFVAGVIAVDHVQRSRLIRKERERTMRHELEQAHQVEVMNQRLREHELQLEDRNRKLLELGQLKSRVFANISHEFRTPLTLILGPLNDALSDDANPGILVRQVPFMRRNASRLLRLVNQLLDLSKLEEGALRLQTEPTDLGHFLRQVVQAFSSRAIRDGITLKYDGPDDEKVIGIFDRDKLEKIITNVLSNALKFTSRGGKVRTTLRVMGSAPEPHSTDANGWIEVLVQDTGRGISPEELPKIFDRFYQVDSSATRTREGSGIGLALTKELVELHGGIIIVESTEGFGTCVTVRLPLHTAPVTPYTKNVQLGQMTDLEVEAGMTDSKDLEMLPVEQYSPSSSPRACVLIVEDNADLRTYLRDQLRDEGYHVEEARDGVEGLSKAHDCLPDLVLTDVMMPRMDGVALCRAIRASKALSHLPVVLLTARAGEADLLESLEAGADDYLSKPFSKEELLLRTENLIEIRRLMRERYSDEVRLGPSELVVSSSEAKFLKQVRDVVEAMLSDNQLTMEKVAEELGLSLRQLHRRLKDAIGLTPAGYVRMMRLKRAAQLLQQDAGTVAEVAYAVGFNNADYFSRLFKQTHGVSPSQYRTT